MLRVTAALLVKNDKILIAKRSENGSMPNKWEFPGGKIEKGETPEECLKREMKEEFSIEVIVKDFFGKSIYKDENKKIELLAYWVQSKSKNLIANVHDEYKWVSFNELSNYDFAPADIPLVKKLEAMYIKG